MIENWPAWAERQVDKPADLGRRNRGGRFNAIFGSLAGFWFSRHFKRLQYGMDPSEVRSALGDPTDSERCTIAIGSVFGSQHVLPYNAPPGAPYLQWRYLRGNKTFVLFFVRVDSGEWKLTLFVSYPSVVDEMILN
ncbi:MAG TPA: hypothetical protein VGI40_20995 [Pirellulaceae bacterium]